MSSAFCSLEEAFAGPVMPTKKKKDKVRMKEGFVPGPLSGMPDTLNTEPMVPAPMGPPQESGSRPDAAIALNDFFPLPGETAEPEEWAKAFTLEGSNVPLPRPDGSVSVAGKSTLWRQIKTPTPAVPAQVLHTQNTPVHGSIDIYQRLETLTQQLETLTTSTPMQSTAELFLFIAIGLLFLLAIDTLLRCATSIALATTSKQGGGVRLGRRRWR